MLRTLATRIGSRPRRTLAIVLLFVIVAGVVGAPVAGKLKSSGGFAPGSSDSQVASDLLARAAGTEAAPAIVLLVHTPQGAGAAASVRRVDVVRDRLAGITGV